MAIDPDDINWHDGVLVSGDIGRLVKSAKSGNVDLMRMDFTADSEILVLSMFGGSIEAEAATFTLTEVTL
jgi:hypothetical protein